MTRLLHHLLTASASREPGRVAVVSGTETIIYAALDEVSGRLARVLVDAGVSRGDRVAFFLGKSIDSVVGIHGILKAGAAYVPLDPDSPPARVAWILGNSGAKCLITTSAKLGSLAPHMGGCESLLAVVIMDDAETVSPRGRTIPWAEVAAAEPLPPPGAPAGSDDLAYILYTSGSTGVPKGVMISHRNALTFVDWAVATVGVKADDRLSNHAPYHFDLSIFDVFAAMKAGATLVLVPPALSVFPYRLAEWIDGQRISIWYSVPSILSMLVRQGDLGRFAYPHLRTVIFAGEVFPVKYLRELMKRIPRAAYLNWYGPTETNVITSYLVPPLAADRVAPIPIGPPCEGFDVFAVNDEGARVSRPGERGELHAAGPCVAHGYWGDTKKTRLGFVAHPLDPESRARCYRTGDYVVLQADGAFLFQGRRDYMIKSRGYRIELGEIESVLYSHDAVREAAVVSIPDDMIGNRIKAFVVREGEGVDASALQDFCHTRLPKYMVPEEIEFRASLPKTTTGKVDRQSLALGE
jgi:amino acid adenylation domain-containing protein